MKNKIIEILNEHNINSYRGVALKCAYMGNYIIVDSNSDDKVDDYVDYSLSCIIDDTPSEELYSKFAIIYEDGILDIIDKS